MLKRIGRRLTFANLASAAALFVALSGGTALALSSGLIAPRSLRRLTAVPMAYLPSTRPKAQ